VYIPLGGNRRGRGRQILNLLAVWFLTGLWHGASWNFVLWGLYYFVLLMLEKTFLLKLFYKLPKFISHVYTLITVVFGWLLFVSTDFASGMEYLATMFGYGRATAFIDVGGAFDWISSLILLLILVIASTPYPKKLLYKLWEKYDAPVRAVTAILCVAVLFLTVAYLVNSSYNPFLYYRF
jgi:alginate O-acetyltransferase complex protein AlgI